jgi:hypothetical protein
MEIKLGVSDISNLYHANINNYLVFSGVNPDSGPVISCLISFLCSLAVAEAKHIFSGVTYIFYKLL